MECPPIRRLRSQYTRAGVLTAMKNEALEFHDSVLMRIDRAGDEIHFLFDAYVHRSSGQPGVDPGTALTVDVAVVFFGAESRSTAPNLPASIRDGGLHIDESEFSNV